MTDTSRRPVTGYALTDPERRAKSIPLGVYARDLIDVALTITRTNGPLTMTDLISAFSQLVAEDVDRVRDFREAVTAATALRTRSYFKRRGSLLTLSPAGEARERDYTRLNGVPVVLLMSDYAQTHVRRSALGPVEVIVLSALAAWRQDLWSEEIADEHERRMGSRPASNQLYETLARLEARGLLSSIESTKTRGPGRKRKHFQLTAAGIAALLQAVRVTLPDALLKPSAPAPLLEIDADDEDEDVNNVPVLQRGSIPALAKKAMTQAVVRVAESIRYHQRYVNDLDELAEVTESFGLLPPPLVERYDREFFRKFLNTIGAVGQRLQTEAPFELRTVAEALALRAILIHAQNELQLLQLSQSAPASIDRDLEAIDTLSKILFQDLDHESLFDHDMSDIHTHLMTWRGPSLALAGSTRTRR
jgi:DNA-binding PadR family transcriptional regulator